MHPFERLLTAAPGTVVAAFEQLRPLGSGDRDSRLARFAQRLGLNSTQLVCAIGFHRAVAGMTDIAQLLGYHSVDALIDARNYLFVNDIYERLRVDQIVEIYQQFAAGGDTAEIGDLILSRLSNIESQIETTINPVLIGGYKLEIRAIYENRLASGALLETRLRPEYEVLRSIADEVTALARSGLVAPAELLSRPGISVDEKRRLVFNELVSRADVAARLAAPDVPEAERRALTEAVANRPS
jgi:hypothetical protein